MTGAELATRLIQAAVIGPSVAAVLWLLLAPWVWPRRVVGGLVALAAHAAAWWVFWLAYLDQGPAWRGLAPSLLTATVVVVSELAVLAAVVRSERRPQLSPVVVVGLGISTTALAVMGYTTSLILLAVVVPVATLAVLAASLVDRSGRRGLVALAAADVVALAGLSVAFDRTETSAIAVSTGLGVGLLLAASAIKAGAVAGVGTARLAAGEATAGNRETVRRDVDAQSTPVPPAEAPPEEASTEATTATAPTSGLSADGGAVSPREARQRLREAGWGVAGAPVLAAVLRGQGILLAAIAAAVMAQGQEMLPAAIVAAVAVAFAGLVAVVAGTPGTIRASVIAAGAAVAFAALGLGGGFGVRAFLVLFPPFLLAAAAAELVASGEPRFPVERRRHRVARALGALGLGVAIGSLVGIPPGGGFPGTWMTVSLAGARGVAAPAYFLLAAGVLVGLALALAGGIRLLRLAQPTLVAAVVAALAALALLYMGAQPLRLGIGWWIRVEEAMTLPTVLPSAGGPTLPAVGGQNLVLALAPGLLLVLLVVGAGRGVRVGPHSRLVPTAAKFRWWPRRSRRPAPPVAAPPPATAPEPSEQVASTSERRGDLADRDDAAPTGEPHHDDGSPEAPPPEAASRRSRGSRLGSWLGGVSRRPVILLVAAALLEVAAVAMAVRLLVLAARAGFL